MRVLISYTKHNCSNAEYNYTELTEEHISKTDEHLLCNIITYNGDSYQKVISDTCQV